VALNLEDRSSCRASVGKTKDNIKMGIKEI
jgi:hypothetical protein